MFRVAPLRFRGPVAPWRVLVAVLFGAMLLVTACDSGDGKKKVDNAAATAGADGQSPQPGATDPAQVTLTPADRATGVDVTLPVTVVLGPGDTLESVKVANAKGEDVEGAVDGQTWKPKVPFTFGAKYTVTAVAANKAGQRTTATASFTTVGNDKKITATFTPEDGSTVGVGQPVSITFNAPVKDKSAVEKALTVSATPAVEGAWHWFGNQRVDYRPKDYWATGTNIKVDLNLRGVDSGNGAKFEQYKSFAFKVAATKTVSIVDVDTKQMKVYKNDQLVKTIPVTTGEVPKYATWGGIMVVQEKYTVTRMNSQTVGLGNEYDVPAVPWAVRITDSGTFVHGNDWAPQPLPFGVANTSHGCVSMTPDNAKWFYDNAAVPGDIVQVKNAKKDTVAADNGYSDWNLTWDRWIAGSAAKG